MKRKNILLLSMLLLAFVLSSCIDSPLTPEIKTGEFDFTVMYEFNGEIKTVSGVYVCEYDGVDWALDGGAHRSWKGYIKGGSPEELILLGTTEAGAQVELELALCPEYFMDDFVEGYHTVPVPYIGVFVNSGEGIGFETDPDIIADQYGARIISYEYAEPIVNTYK